MYTQAFNALDFVEVIEKQGMPREQALTIAKAIDKSKDNIKEELSKSVLKSEEGLATKEDITNLKSELKEDITNLKSELKEDITNLKVTTAELKTELKYIRWAIGTIATCVVSLTIKYLFFGGF